jgi:hypothetical protein
VTPCFARQLRIEANRWAKPAWLLGVVEAVGDEDPPQAATPTVTATSTNTTSTPERALRIIDHNLWLERQPSF